MDTEGAKFCVHCGRKMAADSRHCPNCGVVVDDEKVYEQSGGGQIPYAAETRQGTDHLRVAKILLILYVGVSALGILMLFGLYAALPTGDPALDDELVKALGVASMDVVKEMLLLNAVVGLASFLLAGLSLFYVIKRSKWKPAWIFCAAGTLVLLASFPVSGIVGVAVSLAIGLAVTYMVFASKSQFSNVSSIV